ncbi:MAG TPA: alpha/beta hydrolase [Acetobacteraceae bacterium]|nr:alpha/beta hydrolase [Acetobacteraceae bacterium]
MAMTGERTREIVAQGEVRIEVIAEGSGALLVLLPSSSRDSEDFDDVAAEFARAGLRVLRPQPRGTGLSAGPLGGLTLHDYARDVAAVIEHQRAGPAVVLGHAFGQWVARTLAADRPDLVRGVVLAAAAAQSTRPELREALAKCVDASLPEAERRAALRFAFFAPGHEPPPEWLSGWYPAASSSQRAASAATPREEWWTAGSAPVLDLQGAQDPWRPRETADDFRRGLGPDRVTVVVIEDCSHAMFPEQPEAMVRAVLDWVRGL